MTGLRSSVLAAIFISKRLINLSVDSELCLSPTAFGATEVTFRTRQPFRVPRYFQTIGYDTCDDGRVPVGGDLDSGIVVVCELNGVSWVTANALRMSSVKACLSIDVTFR